MAITDDDVRHVATLARLGLPADRVAALVHELNGILGHMAVLQRVSTAGVGDQLASGPSLVARPDVRDPDPLGRPLADFAPDVRDGLILVPRLGTHDGTESA